MSGRLTGGRRRAAESSARGGTRPALLEESPEIVARARRRRQSDRREPACARDARRARGRAAGAGGAAPSPSRGGPRVPVEVDGRRERLVYLREPGELAAYEELRAGFTAAVSHELRTPLARLLALLETASFRRRTCTELIEQGRGEVEQIRELIDDVLFLSELETGRAVVSLGFDARGADRARGDRRRSPSRPFAPA